MLRRRADRAFGGRDRFAQQPELFGLMLVRSDGRILEQILFQRAFEQSLGHKIEPVVRALLHHKLDQRVPFMFAAQGAARIGQVIEHGGKRMSWNDLETFQQIACMGLAMEQQLARLPDRAEPCPQHAPPPDFGKQAQGRGGDDSQRPFRTDQELFEVEPAIVFLERCERVEHAAIGHDRLQSQHLRAHRSVAQHLCPARIGRDEAAHGSRSLAAQCQRKAQALHLDGVVEGLKHYARIAHDLPRLGVERADRVHSPHAEEQGRAAVIGRGTARHAAIPALGHDRHVVFVTQPHERGDLIGRGRRGEAERLAGKAAAPVGQPWFDQFGIVGETARAEQCADLIDERGRGVGGVIHGGRYATPVRSSATALGRRGAIKRAFKHSGAGRPATRPPAHIRARAAIGGTFSFCPWPA